MPQNNTHERPTKEHAPSPVAEERLQRILSGNWEQSLDTDEYETAQGRLGRLRELTTWRRQAAASGFREFYHLIEGMSRLRNVVDTTQPDGQPLQLALIENLIASQQGSSPRVADLYHAIAAHITGQSHAPQFEQTTTKLSELQESGDLDTLFDATVSWEIKQNRLATRLQGYVRGAKAIDHRDRLEAQDKKPRDYPDTPPPAQETSKPSMDPMERCRDGEQPPAIWTIAPARGGYFKRQSFDTWDEERKQWRQSEYQYTDATGLIIDALPGPQQDTIHQTATIPANQWTRVGVPYTHELTAIHFSGDGTIKRDQNGDYIIHTATGGAVTVQSQESSTPRILTQDTSPSVPPFQFSPSDETAAALKDIQKRKTGNLAKARAIASFVMRTVTYSNDASYNTVYDTHDKGYATAVDTHKQADCDVANTYFAALCAQLNIPVRHVVGDMVKGKDAEGNSRIHGGTGHGWSEVWDDTTNEWIRVDSTPAGDQQLEDDTGASEHIPGDYSAPEAVGPTDEELHELEQKLAELTERLSYTQEERHLAQAADIELKEARKIVKEIQAAERLTLPSGERITDLLSSLFNLIVESRTHYQIQEAGPVRKRDGGERIENIVRHKIGMQAGQSDPVSRERPQAELREEQMFGGFDLYLVGDKSGSMSGTVDGETKWQLQRTAAYLILSSLHRFEEELQRSQARMQDSLSVRTQMISFRGSGEADIDEDKPLSSQFHATDKVKLWHSLGDQGGTNGDVAALSYLLKGICEERGILLDEPITEDLLRDHPEDPPRLRIIIICSDGHPDDVAGVHTLAQQLGQLNAVVVGIGMTETATRVPVIFNTRYSRGDIAEDINDLPVVVAKHVLTEAIKLFPEKLKQAAQKQIDAILAKFA